MQLKYARIENKAEIKNSRFFSGIDLGDLTNLASVVQSEEDAARKSRKLYPLIKEYQNAFFEIEKVKLMTNIG